MPLCFTLFAIEFESYESTFKRLRYQEKSFKKKLIKERELDGDEKNSNYKI